ncbi:glycosyl transferase family 2 [Sphingobacterium mizutaii NBRC 14946 = DSM 11724]|uniref:dTDP-Rha:alpha-D-GlcNAc-pyrophosphate polyprenol, alpha-3-L-rhamnosyltransferase n=2 Tax=Sphingobacterium mizutaii TaxID=1010 RepID=A0AAJ5C1Y7_9SPHI|nr:glycosyltransferase family 2 protein [Sphingobacterium mizutaii]GEM66501.1 glycosyl transferase family 2 [Sphingobacterium mizutaii NBRC 14946 = DSM 11724]SDL52852.1 hypothetical protein SAMN05192578_104259 [Sphingobacterium mizutaii]SNV62703.1 dTDP-Rha:alpha-D-GlcNAc-pyrophosphate polyprenol, alpha-3-L-rhamnosyltransferase [Sphingobacterium mizutaii]
MQVGLSVVLYNTKEEEIKLLLDSISLSSIKYLLIIVDNSPVSDRKVLFDGNENYYYIHNPSNPGFGASHNIAIKESISRNYEYHFVINPDVFFKVDVITPMIAFIKSDAKIGMVMPQILNLDGSIQNLPKLLPSPISLLLRKLKWPNFLYEKFINKYELRFVPNNKIYNAPILSGCFTLFRIEALEKVGLYDDSFFMYFEDWDLSRRVHKIYKTVYYPNVSIYHGYESGANKSRKLFNIFIKSAQTYFNKWGWIRDKERKNINRITLKQFYNEI